MIYMKDMLNKIGGFNKLSGGICPAPLIFFFFFFFFFSHVRTRGEMNSN
jgi:hypothetical protein